MESQRLKNVLLLVIAVCLVLIVVGLYSSVDLVREAHAQSAVASYLYGCVPAGPQGACSWTPARVTPDGRLMVTVNSVKQ